MVYPTKIDKARIMSKALELLASTGMEALSMRKLAQALSVSPSSLYRYFAEREVLLHALEAEVSRELLEAIQQSIQGLDAKESFFTAAQTYLSYARQKPHYYALLLRRKESDALYARTLQNGKALWQQVLAIVGAIMGDEDDTAAAVVFWSFLHGFVVLEQSGNFGASGAKGGFERGLAALLTGLEMK